MKHLVTIFVSVFILFPCLLQAQSAGKFFKTGEKFKEAKEWNSAIEQYNQALALKPELDKAYISRALCYTQINEFQKALDDYNKLKALDVKKEEYCYAAATVCFELKKYNETLEFLSGVTDFDKQKLDVYTLQAKTYMAKEMYSEALGSINIANSVENKAIQHYIKGQAYEKLENLEDAEKEYSTTIKMNPSDKDALLSMTRLLLQLEKYDNAMLNVNKLLDLDKKSVEGLVYRARIYVGKVEYVNAINDLSSAIMLKSDDKELFFLRGTYYQDFTQHQNAINDFSKVILLDNNNLHAYYKRAFSYEQIANYEKAVQDYNKITQLSEFDGKAQELLSKAKERLFELNRENNKPQIVVVEPTPVKGDTVPIAKDKNEINIKGVIIDESAIKSIHVNNVEIPFTSDKQNAEFLTNVNVTDIDSFYIAVTDVYNNKTEELYHIKRTEINPPSIKLLSPYASDTYEVFLDTESSTLYLEGKITDESLIKSIFIDGVTASYKVDELNPTFMATINIANKAKFTVSVTDAYGNQTIQPFSINKEGISILANNPMGKTWAVFIENSDYTSFPSLDGPARDVTLMRSALSGYDIHNIVHKKNLKKNDLERFFAIDLRDIIRSNNVKSVLIWYAGHGKFVNETGYWIPTDANRDDEFSYFSINSLRASLQTYSDVLTHTLVVSDACESGPTFYQAMRGNIEERNCGDWESTKLKSSQVFTSAGYELAIDNSQFTKTFANMLANNPNDCIPIESIVKKVTQVVTENNTQEPKFGKIAGLSDENGTFFFINKK